MSSKKVHFRVSGKITKLLGRESVSQSITALFEVLKNSHDADALSVTLEFRDIMMGKPRIIIKEKSGDGMTYNDVIEKFFVIGTYSKESEDGSTRVTKRFHRKMLGSKGVGRFAFERLGEEVKIISRPINSKDKFTFSIDWNKFEPREVTVDQIGIDVVPEERSDVEDSGLEIEISRLRDLWDEDAIKMLESKIQRLILPTELQPPHAFNIILHAPEIGYNNKLIKVELLKRAYYFLKAELLEDRIKILAKIKDVSVISASNQNDIITEFSSYEPGGGKLTKSEKQKGIKYVKDLTCGPVSLIVYYFPIFQPNSPERRDAFRYYGGLFANLIDTELPNYAGVRIFRDGMREFTYGDPRNDWVDRANISRQLSGTVQADKLIGFVTISHDNNPQIISTTNRQTAVENQAFLDLREFVIQSMLYFDHYLSRERRKLVEQRYDLKRDREAIEQLQNMKKKFTSRNSTITKAFRRVRDLTGEDYTPEIGSFLDAIDSAHGRLQYKIELAEAEMTENQIERSLASLGNIVAMMIHEINDAITVTYREVNKLKTHVTGNEKLTDDELNKIYFNIFDPVNKIKNWNDFVDRFTSTLTLEDIHSRKEDIINPCEITTNFVKNVTKILSIPYIVIQNEINPKLNIRMFAAYFDSIIGNLMSNSIKAINSLSDKEIRENKITVKSEKTNEHLIIYFSDNGPGIPQERWKTVFHPHISSTSKDNIFKGHGLGLPIVNSMVKEYEGDIKIVEPLHAQGTTFRIAIPWNNIDPTK